MCVTVLGDMENCLAAAVLNGVDGRSLQRSARLGLEVLERAKRRAVDWPAQERPGRFSREPAPGPHCLLPGEREERQPTLSSSFRTMAEFMDYASSQCGKYYSSKPEEGGATHVFRYHRGKSELHLCADVDHGRAGDISKDLYIEVYPGIYSVTVGSNALTKKTHVVAVDSGQSVDLVFPV
ncbi:A-kinase-interacting protein 1 isoform X2 [Dipodomys spectabilis]|uniref:A-kinase-interacting protein 1 isoform X2 n=1 Tax=Dipodomys spectabilis TaxID=105255 RepID=UPI001C535634|nr:A-kinase-interacting protein 1 isoform X2 [Dipodomys spectabilis]